MRIGVLGGSFNPIHEGHLAMARAARSALLLDRVIFVPAARPPHKYADLASADDRLAMVRLAIEGEPGFEASELESTRPGPSYTVDTLRTLAVENPGAELFFILGEDSLRDLPGWRDPAGILERARVVTIHRVGHSVRLRPEAFPGVDPERVLGLDRDRVPMPPSPAESRRIRECLRRGVDVSGLVPSSVLAYIHSHGLYRS
jgi:nicotinate-nucleotide adenylyltransferase